MSKFRRFTNRVYGAIDRIPFLRNPLWKAVFAVVISIIVMVSLITIVYHTSVQNPNMILITGLVACCAIFGWPGMIVSVTLMIAYSLYFFSIDHSFFCFNSINTQKIIVISIGAILSSLFVVLFRRNMRAERDELIKHNKRLSDVVYLDALTDVKNRYAFRNDIKEYDGQKVIFSILDIDNFKDINDTYGHVKGDRELCNFAEKLTKFFGVENVYRYGGDEFLILSKKEEDEFASLLKDFKQLLESSPDNHIKFSGGYVIAKYEEKEGYSKLLKVADNNLYKAKTSGKDCYRGSSLIK